MRGKEQNGNASSGETGRGIDHFVLCRLHGFHLSMDGFGTVWLVALAVIGAITPRANLHASD
jgi:hypothetical protein